MREALDLEIGVGVVGDDAESTGGDTDEQVADRRLDHVVGDIQQPLRRGSDAEAVVELGGDGVHACLLLSRRRRTPEEAAWRAASSEDPSAAAISS